ncbi:hypothetical protein BC938DRAFT_474623 [Jimgerdemannia flammicorona]|uniref:Pentacotripeptide-repeat region of PRORP domain-containing protein n=1 Tax=Jimgerdemannia flammicorona TaxID=994334 RepID=A0A433Q235_9FUNG|nr:hypothetical protein BC938DRAFT_474623 [Jimgerdemannia flammicorona]
MRDVHGFRPDRITYNTLLKACARRGDLKRARLIFAEMMKAQRDGEDDVAPNAVTYTNLLWCYASYRAPTPPGARAGVKKTEINAVDQTIAVPHESATLIQHVTTDLAILPPTHPLFPTPPTTRAEILREADSIIMYLCVPPSDGPAPPPLATAHLNAYLATHATHERPQRALEVYDMYAQHGLEPDGHTFNRALEACYRVKDIQFAWKVWEDAERWWEDVEGSRKEEPMGRREQEGLKKNEGKEGLDGISEGEVERRKAGKSEVDSEIGFTEERRYERYKLMVNTLASPPSPLNSPAHDARRTPTAALRLPDRLYQMYPARGSGSAPRPNRCLSDRDGA